MGTDVVCYGFICFVRLNATDPKFFGFSEFLAGLALMVLVWTVAEPRYRFRVQTAPVPLQGITFAVVGLVGACTLMTDLWRAEQWYVPKGSLLTPATWQGLLGCILLLTFMLWAWFAFLRPAVFARANARRYELAVYRAVLRGVESELAVVADELAKSIIALVRYAPTARQIHQHSDGTALLSKPAISAHQIFLMFADPRFVSVLVSFGNHTALSIFQALSESRRYPPALNIFARNFVAQSIADQHSYLYHETEGYQTGFLGYEKPLSTAMFSKFDLVEATNSMLDVGFESGRSWNAHQFRAYTRIVLLVLEAYVRERDVGEHSALLFRAFSMINSRQEAYLLDGVDTGVWSNEAAEKLRVGVEFVSRACELVASVPVPRGRPLRERSEIWQRKTDVYSLIATSCYELVFAAAAVRGPRWTCWQIQHNTVWSQMFGFKNETPTVKLVKRLLRRMLYDDIADMNKFPNYKGAKILGFIFNVCRFRSEDRDCRALSKVAVAWLRKNFASLHSSRPEVAAHCLVDGFTYDPVRNRILIVRSGPLGVSKPRFSYMQLD